MKFRKVTFRNLERINFCNLLSLDSEAADSNDLMIFPSSFCQMTARNCFFRDSGYIIYTDIYLRAALDK